MSQNGPKVVTYSRVSSRKQQASGLGIEAQEALIAQYVASRGAQVVARFSEVRSGLKDRPALKAAIAHARATRSILLIAKLDRAGRVASEVLTMLDKARVKIVFADMPDASDLQLGILAVIAQDEARRISARTKAALACARARGTKLGNYDGGRALCAYNAENGNGLAVAGNKRSADQFASDLASFVAPMFKRGMSDAAVAASLNCDGIETRREGGRWHITSVRRLRVRLAA